MPTHHWQILPETTKEALIMAKEEGVVSVFNTAPASDLNAIRMLSRWNFFLFEILKGSYNPISRDGVDSFGQIFLFFYFSLLYIRGPNFELPSLLNIQSHLPQLFAQMKTNLLQSLELMWKLSVKGMEGIALFSLLQKSPLKRQPALRKWCLI